MRIDGLALLALGSLLLLIFLLGRAYQALMEIRGCPVKNPSVGECLHCPDHEVCERRKVRRILGAAE